MGTLRGDLLSSVTTRVRMGRGQPRPWERKSRLKLKTCRRNLPYPRPQIQAGPGGQLPGLRDPVHDLAGVAGEEHQVRGARQRAPVRLRLYPGGRRVSVAAKWQPFLVISRSPTVVGLRSTGRDRGTRLP